MVLATIGGWITALIVGIALIIIARASIIPEETVNKILYVIGAILVVVGLILFILWILGIVI